MAKQIYRKSLLERMSSPDQLDKMIVITSPTFWLALLGGAVIVVVALIWSIFGSLPINLETSGIFVSDQMAYTLASDTGGIVSSIEVEAGDYVEEGEVLLSLAEEGVQRELTALLERRDKVEAVTLTSVNDEVTADNRDLINIKTQLGTTESESDQNRAMLALYQSELAALRPKVNAAKAQMETARNNYYAYIQSNTNTKVELEFSEIQTRYSQQVSLLTSAEASLNNAKASYKDAVDAVKAALTQAIAGLESADTAEFERLTGVLGGITATTAPSAFTEFVTLGHLGGDTYTALENVYAQYDAALSSYNETKKTHDSVQSKYNELKNAYTSYVNNRAQNEAEKERLGNLYNQLNNDYNALYSQQSNLEANITSIEGQLQAADVGSQVQKGGYEEQFEATRSAILNGLDAEIEKYQYSLEKTNIRATVSGNVADIKVGIGSAVGQGTEVVTIRQLAEDDHIICYIPITSGKRVEPGMEVVISPSTVNRQEYGHMQAEVVTVDDYVTSPSSIRAMLGDDTLAQAFTQNGPVVAVTCKLRKDETTASGYWWSNRKGADLMVPEGTMVEADIVTDEKAPISLLIPFLKEKLTMAVEPVAGNGTRQ